MKNLTWQNPEQLFVAQVLINKVKSKCCGIKDSKKISVEQMAELVERLCALGVYKDGKIICDKSMDETVQKVLDEFLSL